MTSSPALYSGIVDEPLIVIYLGMHVPGEVVAIPAINGLGIGMSWLGRCLLR